MQETKPFAGFKSKATNNSNKTLVELAGQLDLHHHAHPNNLGF